MNQTIKDILERRSIRSYESKPVKAEDLELIIECAKFAPSAMGQQPWHFTVITNREALDKITSINREICKASPVEVLRKNAADSGFDSFRGAPHAIIISGDKNAKFAATDCANATENMAIAAQSLGLATCYIASFIFAFEGGDGAELCRDLGIPDDFEPLYALGIGYANEPAGERVPRKENTVNYVK